MSAVKKYYWIKLKDDFFTQKEIKKLRRIAGGDTYTIIYLKMLLLAIKNDNKIYFDGVEDTFIEELALELDEDVENVSMTVAFLKKHKLIEALSEDEIFLPQGEELTGKESTSSERVKKHREKQKQEQLLIEGLEGEKNIPTIGNEYNKMRYSGNYYKVIKRDNLKCVLCNSNENICVHHIDGYDANKPQNNNMNKMITLCRKCYQQVHCIEDIPVDILESIGYFNEGDLFETIWNVPNSDLEQVGTFVTSTEKEKEKEKEKDINKKDITYNEIYEYFLSKEIVKHKKLTSNMKKAMDKALKDYTLEEIKQGIDNYTIVLKDEKYYYSNIFTLEEFLKQKNGLPHFLEEGIRWINYCNDTLFKKDDKMPKNGNNEPTEVYEVSNQFVDMSIEDTFKLLSEINSTK